VIELDDSGQTKTKREGSLHMTALKNLRKTPRTKVPSLAQAVSISYVFSSIGLQQIKMIIGHERQKPRSVPGPTV
jgi:hypothetical protein